MLEKIDEYRNMGEDAWSAWSACSSFASDAWETAIGEDLQDRHLSSLGYSDPNVLHESIEKANKKDQEKKKL